MLGAQAAHAPPPATDAAPRGRGSLRGARRAGRRGVTLAQVGPEDPAAQHQHRRGGELDVEAVGQRRLGAGEGDARGAGVEPLGKVDREADRDPDQADQRDQAGEAPAAGDQGDDRNRNRDHRQRDQDVSVRCAGVDSIGLRRRSDRAHRRVLGLADLDPAIGGELGADQARRRAGRDQHQHSLRRQVALGEGEGARSKGREGGEQRLRHALEQGGEAKGPGDKPAEEGAEPAPGPPDAGPDLLGGRPGSALSTQSAGPRGGGDACGAAAAWPRPAAGRRGGAGTHARRGAPRRPPAGAPRPAPRRPPAASPRPAPRRSPPAPPRPVRLAARPRARHARGHTPGALAGPAADAGRGLVTRGSFDA